MDDRRFDALARDVAGTTSRRAVVGRLLAGAASGLLGVAGLRRAGAQEDEDDFTITAGGGTSAGAEATGGTVTGGDVVTGGNTGTTTVIGDTDGGEDGGDATVTVDGGDVTSTTEVDISADGGTAEADASGGDGNTVTVEIIDPCAGVTCPVCQTCDLGTGACAATNQGAVCGPGGVCSSDVCVDGACVSQSANGGQVCNNGDGNPCTGVCRNGACTDETVENGTDCSVGGADGFCCFGTCNTGVARLVRMAHARKRAG